jgi:hypothetical protein
MLGNFNLVTRLDKVNIEFYGDMRCYRFSTLFEFMEGVDWHNPAYLNFVDSIFRHYGLSLTIGDCQAFLKSWSDDNSHIPIKKIFSVMHSSRAD